MNLIGFYGIKRNESLVIFDASENYKAQILRLDFHFTAFIQMENLVGMSLIHLDQNKMVDIQQTIFPNA